MGDPRVAWLGRAVGQCARSCGWIPRLHQCCSSGGAGGTTCWSRRCTGFATAIEWRRFFTLWCCRWPGGSSESAWRDPASHACQIKKKSNLTTLNLRGGGGGSPTVTHSSFFPPLSEVWVLVFEQLPCSSPPPLLSPSLLFLFLKSIISLCKSLQFLSHTEPHIRCIFSVSEFSHRTRGRYFVRIIWVCFGLVLCLCFCVVSIVAPPGPSELDGSAAVQRPGPPQSTTGLHFCRPGQAPNVDARTAP